MTSKSIVGMRTFADVGGGPLLPAEVIWSPPVEIGEWGNGTPPHRLYGWRLYPCPALEYFLGDNLDTFCELWQLGESAMRAGLCDGFLLALHRNSLYETWGAEAIDDLQLLAAIAGIQMEA